MKGAGALQRVGRHPDRSSRPAAGVKGVVGGAAVGGDRSCQHERVGDHQANGGAAGAALPIVKPAATTRSQVGWLCGGAVNRSRGAARGKCSAC